MVGAGIVNHLARWLPSTYCVEKLGSDLKVNWPRNFWGQFFVGRVLFCSGQLAPIFYQAGIISASVLLGISHLAIRLRF